MPDDLKPARGIFVYGPIFGGLLWVVIIGAVACAAQPSRTDFTTPPQGLRVVLHVYPDAQALQERYSAITGKTHLVVAFAQFSGSPGCIVHIRAPISDTDVEVTRSLRHELRHCVEGSWHK